MVSHEQGMDDFRVSNGHRVPFFFSIKLIKVNNYNFNNEMKTQTRNSTSDISNSNYCELYQSL